MGSVFTSACRRRRWYQYASRRVLLLLAVGFASSIITTQYFVGVQELSDMQSKSDFSAFDQFQDKELAEAVMPVPTKNVMPVPAKNVMPVPAENLLQIHTKNRTSIPTRNPTSTEHFNIVYIKMIKCASETLTTLFYRFGIVRDLSFVLPRWRKIYLGWPYQLEPGYYTESERGYNILCDHVIYNVSTLEALMPRDTVYITSIREPFSQVRSMFNYYQLARIVGLQKSADPFRDYLLQLEKYDAVYKSANVSAKRYCIPNNFSMTRNLMSLNLGFPTGWQGTRDLTNDQSAIAAWLDELSKRFGLVIVVEHFDESLVLMRRRLSWRWRDVIYLPQNVGNYSSTPRHHTQQTDNVTAQLRDIYRRWSAVDYALYRHFNATLWRSIAGETNDFRGEVAAFRRCLRQVRAFCATATASDDVKTDNEQYRLQVPTSRWDQGFTVDTRYCRRLRASHSELMKTLQKQHHEYSRLDRKPRPPRWSTC